jgi:hypothetical protein
LAFDSDALLVAFDSDALSDSQKQFRRTKPEMPCRRRNTRFFKDGGKTAWWVKHVNQNFFPRRTASPFQEGLRLTELDFAAG